MHGAIFVPLTGKGPAVTEIVASIRRGRPAIAAAWRGRPPAETLPGGKVFQQPAEGFFHGPCPVCGSYIRASFIPSFRRPGACYRHSGH